MNIFGSLLFLHGHVASAELARQLASPVPPRCAPQPAAPVQRPPSGSAGRWPVRP
ncbi:TPA: hypothetical protein QDZ75_001140 [Stenotrophomonas maltophilia]|uniref:hypothetical protein n=1 Tax=Stenotrophomonas TaxID=40323 RepID=UPI00192E5EF5|nr:MULTISPECIES: hypothetical protein [Stenotrophomonas]HDS1137131.1 hypothetical protein [Stenotrophomonas maltophilia]HDS1147744.1 hypothetical protein [Stenotrophomonas maltophilia]HDS1161968.1 hypothetical protein [Stenotrophomonas maltophilia]HEL5401783.1 hypothetical protein [Stenotrophomonas maltophilia]